LERFRAVGIGKAWRRERLASQLLVRMTGERNESIGRWLSDSLSLGWLAGGFPVGVLAVEVFGLLEWSSGGHVGRSGLLADERSVAVAI